MIALGVGPARQAGLLPAINIIWLSGYPMFTVALISRKGEAGKTTLACGLAVAGEQKGLTTALVDLHPPRPVPKLGPFEIGHKSAT